MEPFKEMAKVGLIHDTGTKKFQTNYPFWVENHLHFSWYSAIENIGV